MTAFHADRHARFRRAVSVLRSAGGRSEEGPSEEELLEEGPSEEGTA